jgi:membrane protein
VRIPWREVWIGGLATSLLFTAGKFLLGLYLGRNATVSAYGAAGSVVLILLWVYYSSQILFFGAELTRAHAAQYGAVVQPKEHAEWAVSANAAGPPAEPAPQPQSQAQGRDRKAELVSDLRRQVDEMRALRRQAGGAHRRTQSS